MSITSNRQTVNTCKLRRSSAKERRKREERASASVSSSCIATATAHAASVPAASDGHVVLRDESAGVLRVANAEREFGSDLLVGMHALRLVRAGARLQSGVARQLVASGDAIARLALLVQPRVHLLVSAWTRCLHKSKAQSVCV